MSYRDGYDFRKWYAGSMRKRPRRYWVRWGLTVGLAFVLAIPVLTMVSTADRSIVMPNVMPMSILLFISSLSSPFTREAWLSPRGFATYDEFERNALSAAMHRAYLIDVIAVGAVFLWLMAASRANWPSPTTSSQWGTIGYATVMTMLALPIIFAEFMVPMPDPEDQPA
ncbi:MAG: hypothetical protein GY736_17900 [Sphingomonas sp.]|uniref:hypothetical protein n=1 Tax=unclassified Sphingomonas TaxID=196159 RepID=UPI000F87D4FF|nr:MULTISPECIES: hypothetical protein [unclassified Sphingomonas]MCP4028161.1 hypothetical protein [Sphingomonas sp.]RUN74596.1 hypothetical protein EJC47_20775 [Sphingomonas sp. TF3]